MREMAGILKNSGNIHDVNAIMTAAHWTSAAGKEVVVGC
jgi:hypothetical protein